MTARGLIDTTEMYLKAAYELEEDGVVPLRARIADRLDQSAPTVSQTVARLQRDGLLLVAEDRRLELSPEGRRIAVRVMGKHRLAETLLYRVIGLDWARLHEEACRWEHVMSDAAARRIFELCGAPRFSPYGAPIPGLAFLGLPGLSPVPAPPGMRPATHAGRQEVRLHRISERLQEDSTFLETLLTAGLTPGARMTLVPADGRRFEARTATATVLLERRQASMMIVCDAATANSAVNTRTRCVAGR
ncbi:metal-dependent transcriptional regulator [Amycolatopsis sp. MJM2582]|uniref:metal-dependent transcriptional regulator n=1 Tax=Amycolatopsis sp. MJM2582 TaxID=1427749 RepID=UPI00068B422B|nr:metal-dependent transcriptional regulator [Amycolatopsis sp. MJM2582]